MNEISSIEKSVVRLIVSLSLAALMLFPRPGHGAVNRIFDLVQKGGASSLKDQVMREKDDLVILQALMVAIARNKTEMVKILVERATELGTVMEDEFPVAEGKNFDPGGETVLHRAARSGRAEIVKLLLQKGAPVNQPDAIGRSPLDAANEAILALEGDKDGKDVEGGSDPKAKKDVQATAKKILKFKEVVDILEEAGGKSLVGGGTTIIAIGVLTGAGILAGLAFFLIPRGADKEAAARAAKEKEKVQTDARGDWRAQARSVAGRLAGEQWVKAYHEMTGGSLEEFEEQTTQVNDAVTEQFFPKISSFVFSFSHEKNSLGVKVLVDEEGKIHPLDSVQTEGQWRLLPELKGAVVRLDKQKEARTAFGSYIRLLQLDLPLNSSGKEVEGFTLEREKTRWTLVEPNAVDLELTLDDRGRLNTARGKIRR